MFNVKINFNARTCRLHRYARPGGFQEISRGLNPRKAAKKRKFLIPVLHRQAQRTKATPIGNISKYNMLLSQIIFANDSSCRENCKRWST